MQWRKQGLIFCPQGEEGWMNTHSQVPTALLTKDCVRVYFSTRPTHNLSLTTYVDLDPTNLSKIIHLNKTSIIECGPPGSFDEHGIMPSCAIDNNGTIFMYYTGWSRGTTIPYWNGIGLAVSEDGGATFKKMFAGPILERTPHEPFTAMSPFVYRHGAAWHMYYSSGIGWAQVNGKYEPLYIIKYAHSTDGITWQQPNKTCIEPLHAEEANTRCTVVEINKRFHMWYSYRGSQQFRAAGQSSYRIGYAHSDNLIDWTRADDDAGITVSNAGWDSIMVEYPYIVKLGQQWVMFYNGNNFGETGFGYATLEF